MIQGRCPICGSSFELGSIDELPSFPFCSERCRLVDLGRWIDGDYVIPGQTQPDLPAGGVSEGEWREDIEED